VLYWLPVWLWMAATRYDHRRDVPARFRRSRNNSSSSRGRICRRHRDIGIRDRSPRGRPLSSIYLRVAASRPRRGGPDARRSLVLPPTGGVALRPAFPCNTCKRRLCDVYSLETTLRQPKYCFSVISSAVLCQFN